MANKLLTSETSAHLFLSKSNILTSRYLTPVHGIAVRQVQGGDRIVRQQRAASFEGGTRLGGIARIEQLECLVKR